MALRQRYGASSSASALLALRSRYGATSTAFVASMALHAAMAAFFLWLIAAGPAPIATDPTRDPAKLVYVVQPSSQTGGGRGNPAPAPSRVTEVPEHVLPPPPPLAAPPVDVPPPLPSMDISFTTPPSSVLRSAGAAVTSLGELGGGLRGPGAGRGRGAGLDDGRGGQRGGGPRSVGGGVSAPVPILQVDPAYTAAAMQAKIQGEVRIQAVVRADGSVGDLTIVQSLDRVRGLDAAALRAARQWKFQPSMFEGKPVDVIVLLVLEFRLR